MSTIDVEFDVVTEFFYLYLVTIQGEDVLKFVFRLGFLVQEVQALRERVLVHFQNVVMQEESGMVFSTLTVEH